MPYSSCPKRPETVEDIATTIERFDDGSVVIRQAPFAPAPEAVLAARRQAAAHAAWRAERKAIGRRIGLDAAQELHGALYEQLEAAACDPTAMTPTTFAGLAAKARVAVLLDPPRSGPAGCREDRRRGMSAVIHQHPRAVELVERRKLRKKIERAVSRLIAVRCSERDAGLFFVSDVSRLSLVLRLEVISSGPP